MKTYTLQNHRTMNPEHNVGIRAEYWDIKDYTFQFWLAEDKSVQADLAYPTNTWSLVGTSDDEDF